MSHLLTIRVPDKTFAAIMREAQARQSTPDAVASESIQLAFGTQDRQADDPVEARRRYERHFGSVDLGHPTGIDNESIDADLTREYGSTHEES